MTRRLRIVSFIAVLGCFALSDGSYYLGFELWPPSATMADGTKTPFRSVEMEVCLKERAVAWLGDRGAGLYWRNCQRQLSQYRALDGLEVRFWTVIGFGLFGFAALIAFALSLRFYSPSSKVVRGARLHAGGRGLRAFAQACAGECRIHGEGIALVPSVPLSREREARHFLILGSVGGGKTQTMLHLIGEAIARRDGVLVLDTKGDMMGGLPALGEPLLVAPHDKRSLGLGHRGRLQRQAGRSRTRRPLYSPEFRSDVVAGGAGDFCRLHRPSAGDKRMRLGLGRP
jgi:Type IV secretion-system coupling protein DNA-binding domain